MKSINTTTSTQSNTTEFDTSKIMNFPYYEQIHYPLLRTLKEYNISLVTNNKHNISLLTGNTKDKIDKLQKSGLVYSIPCKDCTASYIGQTKRYLKTRVQEHKNSEKIPKKDARTALVEHTKKNINGKTHKFDFEKVKIVAIESLEKRNIMEMINIKTDKKRLITELTRLA